jgi:hypothetical protein
MSYTMPGLVTETDENAETATVPATPPSMAQAMIAPLIQPDPGALTFPSGVEDH